MTTLQYNAWPRDNDAALDAYFGGRPDGSAKWEVSNLTYIFTPWKSYVAETNIPLNRGIRVHKKVAPSLDRIFAYLWELFGKDQKAIEAVDLHQIGGAYFFRARRGSKRVSNHARGIAIDIDPADNPMRRGVRGDMDPRVVAAFEAEGWRWGAAFGDPMHFEAIWIPKKHAVLPVPKPVAAVPAPAPSKILPKPTTPVAPVPVSLGAMVATILPVVKEEEQFRATRYWDFGQWAIGYGTNANDLPADTVWTEEHASKVLAGILTERGRGVLGVVKVPLTINQGAALLSFVYNLNVAKLASSTLLKKLNAGLTIEAADQFLRWNKAREKPGAPLKELGGLTKRRKRERELFLKP